jgi:hypothetical protein
MAERARYDGQRGSSARSTQARRWYMSATSRVVKSLTQPRSMLLGAGTGLFAIADIPVRPRISSMILNLVLTMLFTVCCLLLLSTVSNPVAYTAQQGQN